MRIATRGLADWQRDRQHRSSLRGALPWQRPFAGAILRVAGTAAAATASSTTTTAGAASATFTATVAAAATVSTVTAAIGATAVPAEAKLPGTILAKREGAARARQNHRVATAASDIKC